MSGRTLGVLLGVLLLLHSAYSVIEYRHHMKDTAHLAHLELPLDIIVETLIGLFVGLWNYVPGCSDLMKAKLSERAKDKLYDEVEVRPSFENFMGNRGKLRQIRVAADIPKPPKNL